MRTCKGYILSNKKNELLFYIEHNHEKNTDEAEKLISLYTIKKQSLATKDNVFEIIVKETLKLENNSIQKIPKLKSISDNMRKNRNKVGCFIVNTFSEIPESLRKTLTNEKFLQYDIGVTDVNRILIFYSDSIF